MTQETLTAFFGWMTVLNFGLLAFTAILFLMLKDWIAHTHHRLYGIGEAEVKRLYLDWMGRYKLLAIVFGLMPYLALRIV